MRGIVLALVAGLVLAGCAGTSITTSEGGVFGAPFSDDGTPRMSGLGCMRGVIVDEGIRPIANATVTLSPGAIVLRTNANGQFSRCNLQPGNFFLRIVAAGFGTTQSSTVVEADRDAPILRIALTIDRSPQPYHLTVKYRGHIDNYLGYAQFAAQVITDAFAPGTLPCTCQWDVTTDPNLATIVLDGTGSVTVPEPTGQIHSVYWEFTGDYLGANQVIQSGLTDFPFNAHIPAGVFANGTSTFRARVTGGLWASGTMDYELFVTFWYRQAAPEHWSFLAASP